MDLLGLLLWFQKKSDGCFASTSWLAEKLSVTERAILKTLKLLEQAGYILRSREGRRRVIICLTDRLPRPKSRTKSSPIKTEKVHPSNSLYTDQKLHNTNPDVDVVLDAMEKEGIKPMVALSLVKRYSKQRIREVINASRNQSEISNKPGWIVKALAADFKFEGGRVEEPPRYKVFERPSEPVDRSGYVAGIQMIRAKLGIVR